MSDLHGDIMNIRCDCPFSDETAARAYKAGHRDARHAAAEAVLAADERIRLLREALVRLRDSGGDLTPHGIHFIATQALAATEPSK